VRHRSAALTAALFVAAVGFAPAPSAAAAPTTSWAPAASASIHPGIQTYDDKGAQCTANFVYTDRTGAVYIGQAAHCTSESGELSGSGCETPSSPLGSQVDLGNNVKGTLAYSSWLAMQKAGEKSEDACLYNDFALIKVPASAKGMVNPSVPIFGGPTGINTAGLMTGDTVMGIGNSGLRGGAEAPLQGFSVTDDPSGWYHLVYVLPPGVPGDSGGGFMDADGRIVGVLVSLNSLPPASNGLSDIGRALAYAQKHSGLKGLRLVQGTESFTG
jgi:hypothetical protein